MGLKEKIYLLSPMDAILSSTLFHIIQVVHITYCLRDAQEPYLKRSHSLLPTDDAFKKVQSSKHIHTYISTKYVFGFA